MVNNLEAVFKVLYLYCCIYEYTEETRHMILHYPKWTVTSVKRGMAGLSARQWRSRHQNEM